MNSSVASEMVLMAWCQGGWGVVESDRSKLMVSVGWD